MEGPCYGSVSGMQQLNPTALIVVGHIWLCNGGIHYRFLTIHKLKTAVGFVLYMYFASVVMVLCPTVSTESLLLHLNLFRL